MFTPDNSAIVLIEAALRYAMAWRAGSWAEGESIFSPRIGRSRALSRPWSASHRLFSYCPVLWKAAGISSSITFAKAGARSVITSTGERCATARFEPTSRQKEQQYMTCHHNQASHRHNIGDTP